LSVVEPDPELPVEPVPDEPEPIEPLELSVELPPIVEPEPDGEVVEPGVAPEVDDPALEAPCDELSVEELPIVPEELPIVPDEPLVEPLRPWRIPEALPCMQSFIARACACTCATSALSFASSLMVAPFFVFSTLTFAFAAIACGSHIPAPMEPCADPELMSEPELMVPEPVLPLVPMPDVLLPLVPVPDVPDVLLPLVPDVPPVVPVMLPLLLVPEPDPVPVPDVEPELPCA
jgi:hypothetical protein